MSEAATQTQDEVAAELPDGWRMETIGELLKVRNGYAFKSKDYTEDGVLLVRQSNLGGDTVSLNKAKYLPKGYLKEHPDFQVKKGDILIGMSGSIGKLCTYDLDESALQNQRTGLLVFQDEDQKPWIWHYLPLLEKGLKEIGKGVAVQNVSAKQIESFSIPIAPLEDQQRIVAEIEKQFSRLDEAVASLKRVKANLKRYKAAALKAAVEGELTEAWRKQNPDVEPASKLLERILAERRTKWEEAELAKMKAKGKEPKNDKWKEKYKFPSDAPVHEPAELPEKWVWATWDQISNWVTYGFTRPMEHVESGMPIVTAKHVVGECIDFVNTHKTPVAAYESLSDKDRPCSGDILITKDGTIGRAAVVPEHSGFCINQSVAVIWLRNCPLSRQFLLAVIQSDLTQKPIAERARGVAIKHLSITDFAKLPVPMAPLHEQRAITELLDARLSVVEEVESELASEIVRCGRLRQSILARAFSGKLVAVSDGEFATMEYVR